MTVLETSTSITSPYCLLSLFKIMKGGGRASNKKKTSSKKSKNSNVKNVEVAIVQQKVKRKGQNAATKTKNKVERELKVKGKRNVAPSLKSLSLVDRGPC